MKSELQLRDGKFIMVTEKVIKIKKELPYIQARELIIWKTATKSKVCIVEMNATHIKRIIDLNSNIYSNSSIMVNGVLIEDWINIFKKELKYRNLLFQYNKFKELFLNEKEREII